MASASDADGRGRAPADRARLMVIAAAIALTLTLTLTLACADLTVSLVGLWVGGVLGWTLLEYALHRWVFHLPRDHPLAVLGARMHHDHHRAPSVAPIVKPPAATLGAFAVGFATAVPLVGVGRAAPAICGLVCGYAIYELLHLAAHRLDAARHPWPAQRARHLAHHHDARRWFGISTPVWDVVCRSGDRR